MTFIYLFVILKIIKNGFKSMFVTVFNGLSGAFSRHLEESKNNQLETRIKSTFLAFSHSLPLKGEYIMRMIPHRGCHLSQRRIIS